MAAQRWRSIPEQQLARRVAEGAFIGAAAALERARAIQKRGHRAAIFQNPLGGFIVLDEDDPAEKRRIAELRRLSRPAVRRPRRRPRK